MARTVDVYANCFVKRDSEVRSKLHVEGAAAAPPQGLRLRDFDNDVDDNEGGR